MTNSWLFVIVFIIVLIIVLLFLSPLPWRKSLVCSECTPVGEEVYLHTYNGNNPMHRDFNPSIAKAQDGYMLAVRRSNIGFMDILSSLINAQCGFESYIRLIRLDSNFAYIKDNDIEITTPLGGKRGAVSGREERFEDPRIVTYKDKIYLVVAYYYSNISVSPAILELNCNFQLQRVIHLKGPTLTEKNWCPFIHRSDRFLLHTDSYPVWRVREVDLQSGEMKTVVESRMPVFCKKEYPNLRCSTSWASTEDGNYLCALHTKEPAVLPIYRTVLILIDGVSLTPIAKSKKLCLEPNHCRIQFASGLLVEGDDAYITLGLADMSFSVVKVENFHKHLSTIALQ